MCQVAIPSHPRPAGSVEKVSAKVGRLYVLGGELGEWLAWSVQGLDVVGGDKGKHCPPLP